jgi:hypothetical protein
MFGLGQILPRRRRSARVRSMPAAADRAGTGDAADRAGTGDAADRADTRDADDCTGTGEASRSSATVSTCL